MAAVRPADRLPTLAESFVLMGTVVTLRVVGRRDSGAMKADIRRALALMRSVETTLSRFDEGSDLRRLVAQPGMLVPVTPMLFHALRVAVEVASLTEGAFDPSVGRIMEDLGFDCHYLTGRRVATPPPVGGDASYRDITLLEDGLGVRLERPMALDLDAVAKGLAIDLAARSLEAWDGVLVDAGGDLFVSGVDPSGDAWKIGIEDPREPSRLLATLRLTGRAICTSGGAKRRSPTAPGAHHLVDARTGSPVPDILSCTVVGPTAMMADTVATAAFVLGRGRALSFIEDVGLDGLVVTSDMCVEESDGMGAWAS